MFRSTYFGDAYVVDNQWFPVEQVGLDPVTPLGSGNPAFNVPSVVKKADGTIVYFWVEDVGGGSYELKVGYADSFPHLLLGGVSASVTEDHSLLTTQASSEIAPYVSVTDIDGVWYMILIPGTTGDEPTAKGYAYAIHDPDAATPCGIDFDERMETPDWDNPDPKSGNDADDRGPSIDFIEGRWYGTFYYPNEWIYKSTDEGETWTIHNVICTTSRVEALNASWGLSDSASAYAEVLDPEDGLFSTSRVPGGALDLVHNYIWDGHAFNTDQQTKQPSPITVTENGNWIMLLPMRSVPYHYPDGDEEEDRIYHAGYGDFFGRASYIWAFGSEDMDYYADVANNSLGGLVTHPRNPELGWEDDQEEEMPYRHLQGTSPNIFQWTENSATPGEAIGAFLNLDVSDNGLTAFSAFIDPPPTTGVVVSGGGGGYGTRWQGEFPAGVGGAGFCSVDKAYGLHKVSSSFEHLLKIDLDDFPVEHETYGVESPTTTFEHPEYIAAMETVRNYTGNDNFGGSVAYPNNTWVVQRVGNFIVFTNGNSIVTGELAVISGYVFLDDDSDAVMDGGESVWSDESATPTEIVLTLWKDEDEDGSYETEVTTFTVGADGYYEMPVTAGDFKITVALPETSTGTYIVTNDSLEFTADGTNHPDTLDIGLVQPGMVSGNVFYDDDEDGTFDGTDYWVEYPGLTISIYDGITLVASGSTDALGYYEISDIPPNDELIIRLSPPTSDYECTNPVTHTFTPGESLEYNPGISLISILTPSEDGGWGFIPVS